MPLSSPGEQLVADFVASFTADRLRRGADPDAVVTEATAKAAAAFRRLGKPADDIERYAAAARSAAAAVVDAYRANGSTELQPTA